MASHKFFRIRARGFFSYEFEVYGGIAFDVRDRAIIDTYNLWDHVVLEWPRWEKDGGKSKKIVDHIRVQDLYRIEFSRRFRTQGEANLFANRLEESLLKLRESFEFNRTPHAPIMGRF